MTFDKTARQNRVREALGRLYDQQPPYFREYLKRFQEDPTSRVFAPLAEAFRRLGRVDEAIEISREGLQHHPDFHGGRVALAKCLMDKRRYTEAREELQRVVRSVPENLLAQKLLGETNESLGNAEEALHSFKMALLLSPADVALAEKVHRMERAGYEQAQGERELSEIAEDLTVPSQTVPTPTAKADGGGLENFSIDDELNDISDSDASPDFLMEDDAEPLGENLQSRSVSESHQEDEPSPWVGEGENGFEFGEMEAPTPSRTPVEKPRSQEPPRQAQSRSFEIDLEEDDQEDRLFQIDDAKVMDEASDESSDIDSLLAEDPADHEDEGFRVAHVSDIFSTAASQKEKEITTETLGDLYLLQGQYEKALGIFERLPADKASADIQRKISACRSKLGVDHEALARNRKIAVLRGVLAQVRHAREA